MRTKSTAFPQIKYLVKAKYIAFKHETIYQPMLTTIAIK